MNCEKCDVELDSDPWLIGVDVLDKGDKWYAKPLCEDCYVEVHPNK